MIKDKITTKEYIEEVEKLGFKAKKFFKQLCVFDGEIDEEEEYYESDSYAVVSMPVDKYMDYYIEGRWFLKDTTPEAIDELMRLTALYGRTPVEDREEIKRYNYKLKEKNMWIIESRHIPIGTNECYLNIVKDKKKGDFPWLDNNIMYEEYICEFTDIEMEKIAKKFNIDLNLFDKIEVE